MASVVKRFDCVVCGSCTIDVLAHPVDLLQPIGVGRLHRVAPIELSVGGIVSNAGVTMARMGMRVAAFSAVGQDRWGDLVLQQYGEEGIDTRWLARRDDFPTSTSVVLIDAAGDRSFIHSQGAPKAIRRDDYLAARELFASSRAMLLGYYPLMPGLLDDLAGLLQQIRASGCLTALDAAGGGGTMQPLDKILPHLDVYCPSIAEAAAQTGESDPERMIATFRSCGARGVLGIKLGADGALLSGRTDQYLPIAPVPPPGEVVDTTGAGDAFYAGLLTGLLIGLDLAAAGRLAAATGARSVTAAGATTAASTLAANLRNDNDP